MRWPTPRWEAMNHAQEHSPSTRRQRRTLAIVAVVVGLAAAGVVLRLTTHPTKHILYGACGTPIEVSAVHIVPGVVPTPIIGQAEPAVTEMACSIS